MLPDEARWRLLDRELAQLLALSDDARASWLEDRATRDPQLVADLRRLLAASDASEPLDRLNTSPLYAQALAELPGVGPGDELGGWRLLQRIGTGGMSEVYLAEREHNSVCQRAALKLMATGMAAPALRSGFMHECRFLAALSDARIARYYDSGVADDGRPWLAMEHVEGLPLDRFVHEHAPTLPQRLDLFLEIAGAVAHAHERLIVHRDLKPSNVMVTPAGQVKLLDFGIARALGDAIDPVATAASARVLTLEYASPEQINGDLVNIASDVYQLGLLLYLLVAGRYAHADGAGDRARLMLAILHDTPEPPSRVLRCDRSSRGEALTAPGDLDAIVLKALEKAPSSRYATVEALCADVRAWRGHRPIQARRSGIWRRGAKFVRRHSIAAAIAATTLAAGAAFGGVWFDQSLRAAREAKTAQAVLALLTEVLYVGRYGVEPQPPETVAALLGRVEDRARERLSAQPEVLARTLLLVGRAHLARGDYRRALEVLREVQRMPAFPQQSEALRDELETALVSALHFSGEYDEASQLSAAHRARLQRHHGDTDPRLFGMLLEQVDLMHSLGHYANAQTTAEQLLALTHTHFGAADARTAAARRQLGMVQRDRGQFEEAEAQLRTAERIDRAALGARHVNLAADLDHLGQVYLQRGDLMDAQRVLDEADAIRRHLFQPGTLSRVWARHRLAQLQLMHGDHTAAIAGLQDTIGTYSRSLGDSSHITAMARSDLGWALLADGRHAAAATEFTDADALMMMLADGRHPRRGEILLGQAVVALADGDTDAARALAQQALDLRHEALQDAHPALAANCHLLHLTGGDCTATLPASDHALAWRQLELALAAL